jgi:hypothetical protein
MRHEPRRTGPHARRNVVITALSVTTSYFLGVTTTAPPGACPAGHGVCRPAPRVAAAGARGGGCFATGGVERCGGFGGRCGRNSHDFRLAADVISGEFSVAESGIFRIGLGGRPTDKSLTIRGAGDRGAAADRARPRTGAGAGRRGCVTSRSPGPAGGPRRDKVSRQPFLGHERLSVGGVVTGACLVREFRPLVWCNSAIA